MPTNTSVNKNSQSGFFALIKQFKQESLLSTIKSIIIYMIKSETGSFAGKVNLIFGLLLVGMFLSSCIQPIFVEIMNILLKTNSIPMPWYGILIFAISIVLYFGYCMKKVDFIQK